MTPYRKRTSNLFRSKQDIVKPGAAMKFNFNSMKLFTILAALFHFRQSLENFAKFQLSSQNWSLHATPPTAMDEGDPHLPFCSWDPVQSLTSSSVTESLLWSPFPLSPTDHRDVLLPHSCHQLIPFSWLQHQQSVPGNTAAEQARRRVN